MKQLFWKEWRELRLLPIGAALLCFLLQFGFFAMCSLAIGGERPGDFTLYTTRDFAWGLWCFFAILAGSGLISQEIGAGTLSFLFALPTGRRQIWLCKIASGACSLALCVISSAIVTLIVDTALSSRLMDKEYGLASILFGSDATDALLCAFGCFAVSIAVSPLVDRYISAASVSVGVCLVLSIGIVMGNANYTYQNYPNGAYLAAKMGYAFVWLCIPAFSAISYWTFTHGETLRSSKRFYAAGRAALVSLIAFLVLFAFARSYVLAQSASLVRHEESTAVTIPPGATGPTTLHMVRETDSLGHVQYLVQMPDPTASYSLVMEWKIDGSRVGKSSGFLESSNPVRIGAWLDSNEDIMVKSVLSAQGVRVSHPNDVTFGLHMVGVEDRFSPITLHFKHRSYWSSESNGLSIDTNRPYKTGEKLTILDEILIDSSVNSTHIEDVPNDSSSEKLFESGAAHRVTVTAIIEPPADDSRS